MIQRLHRVAINLAVAIYSTVSMCSTHYCDVVWSTCNSCNMGMRDLPDMYARRLRAYISGKSRVHMLQLICNTSGTLKTCPNLTSIFQPLNLYSNGYSL